MIVIAALIFGALLGYRRAATRGGNGFDRAQYTVVHAIALGLVGLIVTIIIDRMV
jgi:hypothetical protein